MVSKAIARFARLSPRKARVMVDLVRGRQAGEALQLLEFTKKAGAPVLKKLIESAVANARTTSPGVDLDAPLAPPRDGSRDAHPEGHEPHHHPPRPALRP